MSVTAIEKVGEATRITDNSQDNGDTFIYTWKGGRFIVKPNLEDIEVLNEKVSPKDTNFSHTLKFSQQTEQYGTSNAKEYVEYLILNDIFFLDGVNLVETKSKPEAIKITEDGKITYFAWAKPGSLYSDAVWKCMRLDETDKLNTNTTWADNANYTQSATDLTSLTYS